MEEVVSAGAPQSLLLSVVRALEAQGVLFCYWKSSLHLGEALAGEKDFDLLVDPPEAALVRGLLRREGLKPARPGVVLPGEEHWVGYEPSDGRLRHVHLQFEIHAGTPPVYELVLPWREHLLSHVIGGPYGVPVLEPSLEAALLLARVLVEPKHWTRGELRAQSERDLELLLERAVCERARAHLAALLGSEEVASRILDAPMQARPHAARHITRRWARVGPARLRALVGAHQARSLAVGVAGRLSGWAASRIRPPTALRRPDGGLIVAIVGADGSGKSTQSERVRHWLSEAYEVEQAYLGRGDWVSRAQQ
ncbi:MAG: hypothetical protein IT378_01360, partial [Sandaracinaceae bacterium]|nr:hypothetical protein [Sandaracinaceae bacterium]